MIDIQKAKSRNGLIRQLGKLGKSAGTVSGIRKRDTVSKEAYIIRRYLLWRIEIGDVGYPISIRQRDAPDFIIIEAGDKFGIEFTEATDQQSGQLYNDPDWEYLPDALGGPVTSGVVDNVISHIRDALKRKSEKEYAGQYTDLIIYPNSPDRMAIGLFGNIKNKWNETVLNAEYDVSAFRNVYLFLSLIHI